MVVAIVAKSLASDVVTWCHSSRRARCNEGRPPVPLSRLCGRGVRGEGSSRQLERPSPPAPLPQSRERGAKLIVALWALLGFISTILGLLHPRPGSPCRLLLHRRRPPAHRRPVSLALSTSEARSRDLITFHILTRLPAPQHRSPPGPVAAHGGVDRDGDVPSRCRRIVSP